MCLSYVHCVFHLYFGVHRKFYGEEQDQLNYDGNKKQIRLVSAGKDGQDLSDLVPDDCTLWPANLDDKFPNPSKQAWEVAGKSHPSNCSLNLSFKVGSAQEVKPSVVADVRRVAVVHS